MAQQSLFPVATRDRDAQPYSAEKKTTEFVSETLKVEVLTAPQSEVAKSGKSYCQFVARDTELRGKGTFKVVAFKSACDFAKTLSVGDEVAITGKPSEREGDGFLAWSIAKAGQKAQLSPKARIVRDYGSVENYKAARKREVEFEQGCGRILVKRRDGGGTHWVNRSRCCEHRGEWKEKIDALMDEYGGAVIGAEVKSLVISNCEIRTEVVAGMHKATANWVPKYNRWLDDRVRKMLGQEEENIFV